MDKQLSFDELNVDHEKQKEKNMKQIIDKFNWEDFSIQKIEKKHDIRGVAKREALVEEPCASTNGSITEGEIKQECDAYIQKHQTKLRKYLEKVEDNQNQLSGYLQQNHFDPIVNSLDSKFHSKANEKEIALNDLHNNYKTYKEEQNQFRKYHQLSREPNFATTGNTIKHLGLILILFLIEAFLNGSMLQGALVGGPVEGVGTAVAVAGLNCLASGLAGYYIFKKINHLERKTKILWGFFAMIWTTFIVYLNFCLGAYRSKSEEVFQKIYGSASESQSLTVEQSLETLSKAITPWSSDIEFMFVGLMLAFVGIFFAALSIISGLLYNDTYPGYGNVGKKVDKYRNQIRKTFKSYAKDISKLFAQHNIKLQETFDNIRNKELNYWDANTNIIQKEFVNYEQKINSVERGSQHIIDEYRKENIKVRKSNPPAYFEKSFELPEDVKNPLKVFPDINFHYMSDQEREQKKLRFLSSIDQNFKQSEKDIEELQATSINKQKELHEKYNTN